MQLHVCSTGNQTLALAFLEVEHPTQVVAALHSLRVAAQANFSATQVQTEPLHVLGMTPNPNAVLVSMQGVSTRGAPVRAGAAFFSRGLRIYQATLFGAEVDPEVWQTFIAGLRLE